VKSRRCDLSEIRALEFKGEFRRSAISSVSATIDIDWSIFDIRNPDRQSAWLQKNTVNIQLRHFLAIPASCAFRGRLIAIVALLTGLLGG
jgi:hypothetical protein